MHNIIIVFLFDDNEIISLSYLFDLGVNIDIFFCFKLLKNNGNFSIFIFMKFNLHSISNRFHTLYVTFEARFTTLKNEKKKTNKPLHPR